MDKNAKVLIVGHDDVIERSLFSYFQTQGFKNVFSSSLIGLNPTIQSSVYEFFQKYRPEYVFFSSTRSGGIKANQEHPAEFIYHNTESQNNIIYSSWKFGVKKLLYLGSSCVYPKDCPQPMKEEHLSTGKFEETSQAYSVAKLAGIETCRAFRRQYGFNAIVAIPATIYGPGSDTDIATAHVMGALIAKFTAAIKANEKEVVIWGSGKPRREFLYADDFVRACVFLMDQYEEKEVVHIGSGQDVAIAELAEFIKKSAGFQGKIVYDSSKPDGVMQKLLDSSLLMKLGWQQQVSLEEGIKRTVQWYLKEGRSF